MIGGYLNQTATYREVTARNSSNEPIATMDRTIKVRQTGGLKLVRNQYGDDIQVHATILVNEPLEINSLLNFLGHDWPIMDCAPAVDMGGSNMFYEVVF